MNPIYANAINRSESKRTRPHNLANSTRPKFRTPLMIIYVDSSGDAHFRTHELMADTPASRRYINAQAKRLAAAGAWRSWKLINLNWSELRGFKWHVLKGASDAG